MKRFICISIILFSVLLSACSDYSLKPSENSMVLSFKNDAQFDFYTLEMSTGNNTTGISYADGSKIKKGELLQFEYLNKKDLNLDGEATFQLVLINKEGRFPVDHFTLELATNKEYLFEIRGNSIEDAQLLFVR